MLFESAIGFADHRHLAVPVLAKVTSNSTGACPFAGTLISVMRVLLAVVVESSCSSTFQVPAISVVF